MILALVLGTGSGQVVSRNWASQKPNLLNVAITRARQRSNNRVPVYCLHRC